MDDKEFNNENLDEQVFISDDEQLSAKEFQKLENNEVGQNDSHLVGKGLSTYYGETGGQSYETVSNTSKGQRYENKAGRIINRNPATKRGLRNANRSGMLDETNNAKGFMHSKPNNVLNKESLKKNDNLPKQNLNNTKNTKSNIAKKINSKASSSNIKKKLVMTLLKNPTFWIGAGLCLVAFVFVFLIAAIALSAGEDYGSSDSGNSYSYNSYGVNAENVQVELINCDGKRDNYKVLKTIPFEEYITGVALAEMGPDASDEALKAQMIMVRNFSLNRNQSMCPGKPKDCFYGIQSDGSKMRLRACENDQVYWDYTQDIYRLDKGAVSNYSPEVTSSTAGAVLWKSALSDERRAEVENLANSVSGYVALNANGKIAGINYTDTQTQKAIELANQGKDYVEIIKSIYPNVSTISQAAQTAGSTNYTGDYTTWKQYDARWKNQLIRTNTIGNIGCAATSLAIVLARSGVETTIDELNPGTFVKAYNKVGGFVPNNSIVWGNINKLTVNNDLHHSYEVSGTFTNDEKKTKIKEMINDGCFIVMQVKGGTSGDTHYVVIDDIKTKANNFKTIYMWDPGSSKTDLFAKYNRTKKWGNKFRCYKTST